MLELRFYVKSRPTNKSESNTSKCAWLASGHTAVAQQVQFCSEMGKLDLAAHCLALNPTSAYSLIR